MLLTVKEITSRVYDLMDENSDILEERVEYADPGTQLGPLIAVLLPEAARTVLEEAPLDRFDTCTRLTSATLTRPGDNMAEMQLPADFMRFVYCRMDDWSEGVTTPLEYGSMSYRLRHRMRDKLTLARTRPAVAIRNRGLTRQLIIYGTGPTSNLAELEYIPVPEVKDDSINLPKALVHNVCSKLAEMVTGIIGDRAWK